MARVTGKGMWFCRGCYVKFSALVPGKRAKAKLCPKCKAEKASLNNPKQEEPMKPQPQAVNPREAYELENAPYLIEGAKLVRNYELLKGTEVSNDFVLDYIDCGSHDEAKHLRGLLWNAFAGGRNLQKAVALRKQEAAALEARAMRLFVAEALLALSSEQARANPAVLNDLENKAKCILSGREACEIVADAGRQEVK